MPLHIIDWFPTLVNLAGGSLEQKLPLDGRDVWPMLTQGAPSPHEAILLCQSPDRAALRMGDRKLIIGKASDSTDDDAPNKNRPARRKPRSSVAGASVELYNLADDPGERTNLAEKEPEHVAAMRARLDALLKDAVPPGHTGKQ